MSFTDKLLRVAEQNEATKGIIKEDRRERALLKRVLIILIASNVIS